MQPNQVSFAFSSDRPTTISSEDYFTNNTTNATLQFNIGDHRQCYLIKIQKDDICEWNEGINEQLSLELSLTKGYQVIVDGDRNTTIITVDDQNEPECSKFSF